MVENEFLTPGFAQNKYTTAVIIPFNLHQDNIQCEDGLTCFCTKCRKYTH